MPYIEIRMEYDSWCKEHGIDAQAFVDKMLGECIRGEQESEAKEAARAKADEEKQKQAEKMKKQEWKPLQEEKHILIEQTRPEKVDQTIVPEETRPTGKKKTKEAK